ncbi:uncharacterized protein METZ01_LOCUS273860, partial [marine metagenome]
MMQKDPFVAFLIVLSVVLVMISPTEAQETSDSPVEPICNANR